MALQGSEEELSNKENEKRMCLHADHEEGRLEGLWVHWSLRKAREGAANESGVVDPDMGLEPLRSHKSHFL